MPTNFHSTTLQSSSTRPSSARGDLRCTLSLFLSFSILSSLYSLFFALYLFHTECTLGQVHLKVELPDLLGRRDILRIHTRAMRRSGALAADAAELVEAS